ncbi:hypothetical protein [Deminuibacter soli]|uniref:Uncharacterized protein n=1 Tax=Deminuibacter soli TaxID=2291815 RepID=A0A3E1NQ32_9BACT|nr:hypothetical protein [Deminuibacter soli]RFM30020.1 hypothetical protein DXN05_03345 [Deminuibacter soli]
MERFDLYIDNPIAVGIVPEAPKIVGMMATDGNMVAQFPVTVYNATGQAIGVADDKAAFIGLWNSDGSNQKIGRLYGAAGPFAFTLALQIGASLQALTANPVNDIIDVDQQAINDNDKSTILFQ